jgi:hypothetical protein
MYNSDHTATECIGQKIFFFSSLLNQLMSSLDSFIQLCDINSFSLAKRHYDLRLCHPNGTAHFLIGIYRRGHH